MTGVICAAEPIMTKWKWWLGNKLPAKTFIINENGDYFWLDRLRIPPVVAVYRLPAWDSPDRRRRARWCGWCVSR